MVDDFYMKLTAWGGVVVAATGSVLAMIGVYKFWTWYKSQIKNATIDAVKDVVADSIKEGLNKYHEDEEERRKLRLDGYTKDFTHLKETSEKNTKMLAKSILSVDGLIRGEEGVLVRIALVEEKVDEFKKHCKEIQDAKAKG